MLFRRRAISWGRRRNSSWTWFCGWSRKIRRISGEERLEKFCAEIRFRRVLIRPDRYWHGVIGIVQFRFYGLDFVLLHEQKISVQRLGQVVFFVVTDATELTQNPR